VPNEHKKEIFYRRDMKVEINGVDYVGHAVLEDVTTLKMKIDAKDDIAHLRIKTCHRVIDIEKAWSKRLFGSFNKNKAKVTLKLNSPIETKENCPIEIIAFSLRGKHSWFYIDKKEPRFNLPAKYICNGNNGNNGGDEFAPVQGVGICQTMPGLEQEFNFPAPVRVRTKCPYERVSDEVFIIKPVRDYCIYTFMDEKKRYHRLTTIGYESIKLKKQ
jgi:hypothetical protein